MAKVRFPGSNFLKFVRIEDYTTKPQNDNTRLYFDLVYPNTEIMHSVALMQRADTGFIQFRTDYSDFNVFIYNSAGSYVNVNSWLSLTTTLEDGRSVYNLDIPFSSLDGYYYLYFVFSQPYLPVATFRSEWFWVQETHENSLLFGWNTSENDGMYWGSKTQYLRFTARLSVYEPGSENFTYTDSSGNLEKLRGLPQKIENLQLDAVPRWLIEKLNIALAHEVFSINELYYQTSEKIEAENIEGTTLYSVQVKLRQLNYEDYSTDEELEGTPPVITPFNLLINDGGDKLLINDDSDKLLISS